MFICEKRKKRLSIVSLSFCAILSIVLIHIFNDQLPDILRFVRFAVDIVDDCFFCSGVEIKDSSFIVILFQP